MSVHRITAIIAFALCASGAFATNESATNEPFDCEENWPCEYGYTNDAKYYDHKIDDYKIYDDSKWPYDAKSRYGQTVLHFQAAGQDYQLFCHAGNDDHDVIMPGLGVKVYVVGKSNSYVMPRGWHWVSYADGRAAGYTKTDYFHDYVVQDNYLTYYLEHEFPYWEGKDPITGAIWECKRGSDWVHNELNPNSLDDLRQCNDLWADLPDDGMESGWWTARAAVSESVLLPDLDDDTAYRVIIKDGSSAEPCPTKRCRSGFKATCNNENGTPDKCNSYDNTPQCQLKNSRCTGANGTMALGESDLNDCTAKYNSGIGRTYIAGVESDMYISLQTNIDLAQRISELDPENGSFTCNNNGCNLKTDVFNGQRCEFRCFADDIHVRLAPEQDGERYTIKCPKYFKPARSDDGQYKYTCVFDTDAAQRAIDNKQAEATNACATAICGASGGVYDSATQNCKCGNDVCMTEFFVNGKPLYKYCGGEQRGGITHFCVDNELGTGLPKEHPCHETKRTQATATDCYKELVQAKYDATEACATAASSAASGNNSAADDADDDNISELAKTLDAIEDAYGLSKWRTVDDKFNYARLASDATAAVVLGTTGALVTSSVVKKKQVEAGFESLECTVGGQHVGDWGDVFRIDGK